LRAAASAAAAAKRRLSPAPPNRAAEGIRTFAADLVKLEDMLKPMIAAADAAAAAK